jgi:hypothetical protein
MLAAVFLKTEENANNRARSKNRITITIYHHHHHHHHHQATFPLTLAKYTSFTLKQLILWWDFLLTNAVFTPLNRAIKQFLSVRNCILGQCKSHARVTSIGRTPLPDMITMITGFFTVSLRAEKEPVSFLLRILL